MSGGRIVIRPRKKRRFAAEENVIAGNTIMYGAIGGTVFLNGRAGERFCVRNSGATAVVEGIGDHGCEYMTGGTVVVLGATGKNFAAGMTGGVAYIFDPEEKFLSRYNSQLVTAQRFTSQDSVEDLKSLIEQHHVLTGSEIAQKILSDWPQSQIHFWRVSPHLPVAKPVELEVKQEDEQTSTIITEAITVSPGV